MSEYKEALTRIKDEIGGFKFTPPTDDTLEYSPNAASETGELLNTQERPHDDTERGAYSDGRGHEEDADYEEDARRSEDAGHEEDGDSKPQKKKKGRYQQRLDQLIQQNYLKEQNLYEISQRLEATERRNRELEMVRREAEKNADNLKSQNLNLAEFQTINAINDAKDAEDRDTEEELRRRLIDIQIEKRHSQDSRNRQSEDDFIREPIRHSYQPQPEVSPYLSEFMERNAWANPGHPHFDPELYQEAYGISEEMKRALKYQGHADLIETEDFYNALSNQMNQRWAPNSSQQKQPQKTQQQSSRGVPVAPVSRTGASMAEQYASQHPGSRANISILTADERAAAFNTSYKIAPGHTTSGDESVRYAAEQKLKRMQSTQSNPERWGFTVE